MMGENYAAHFLVLRAIEKQSDAIFKRRTETVAIQKKKRNDRCFERRTETVAIQKTNDRCFTRSRTSHNTISITTLESDLQFATARF